MAMGSRAVLVRRRRVFLRLVMAAVVMVVGGLTVVMRSRFVMRGGIVVVFRGRMFCRGHVRSKCYGEVTLHKFSPPSPQQVVIWYSSAQR